MFVVCDATMRGAAGTDKPLGAPDFPLLPIANCPRFGHDYQTFERLTPFWGRKSTAVQNDLLRPKSRTEMRGMRQRILTNTYHKAHFRTTSVSKTGKTKSAHMRCNKFESFPHLIASLGLSGCSTITNRVCALASSRYRDNQLPTLRIWDHRANKCCKLSHPLP